MEQELEEDDGGQKYWGKIPEVDKYTNLINNYVTLNITIPCFPSFVEVVFILSSLPAISS